MVKKILLGVAGVVVLLVVGVLGAAAMQPDTTHVERSVTVAAPPADVFPFANNFDLWVGWSPWQHIDPNQVVTYSPSHEGKGAWYEWTGNKDVGHGRMTIVESSPPGKVVEELHFMEPFESTATATLTFVPEGDNTRVTWAFDEKQDLMGKTACLFMNMDQMLGDDFQRGLDQLKPQAEAVAQARMANEKAAAEAVPTDGAPADPGGAVPADPAAAPAPAATSSAQPR